MTAQKANWVIDEDAKRCIGRRFQEGCWQKSVDWAISDGLQRSVEEAFEESGIKEKLKAEVRQFIDSDEFQDMALAKLKQVVIDAIGKA